MNETIMSIEERMARAICEAIGHNPDADEIVLDGWTFPTVKKWQSASIAQWVRVYLACRDVEREMTETKLRPLQGELDMLRGNLKAQDMPEDMKDALDSLMHNVGHLPLFTGKQPPAEDSVIDHSPS